MMFNPLRTTAHPLVDSLRELGDESTVFVLEDAWLVVSPAGVFVLTEDDGDLAAAAERAAIQASAVREQLADKMAWVPFVDAMCVTTATTFDPSQPCLVVPHDLIASTVCGGPVGLDEDSLRVLNELPFQVLQ